MPTFAQMNVAFDLTATTGVGLSTFNVGDIVYDKTKIDQNPGDNQPFPYIPLRIIAVASQQNASGDFLDLNGAVANGSLGPALATSANFFRVSPVLGGSPYEIHDSNITDLAGIQTLVGTEAAGWIDPA